MENENLPHPLACKPMLWYRGSAGRARCPCKLGCSDVRRPGQSNTTCVADNRPQHPHLQPATDHRTRAQLRLLERMHVSAATCRCSADALRPARSQECARGAWRSAVEVVIVGGSSALREGGSGRGAAGSGRGSRRPRSGVWEPEVAAKAPALLQRLGECLVFANVCV